MLYRIESHLKIYFYYLVASAFIGTFWWISFLFSGTIGQTIVSRDVQRMGTAFVCGFTDTFVFFWMLLVLVLLCYCIYMVWSAAEDANGGGYPDLMKYGGAIKGHSMPLPMQSLGGNGPRGMGGGFGGPGGFQSAPPMMGGSFGYGGSMPRGPMSAPPTGMYGSVGPAFGGSMGAPQSFVPAPVSRHAG